jgi:glycosyltransferase involved in cell wall biosynthesis
MQLVIPAYNEAGRLPRTLAALRRHVAAEPVRGGLEVIVVDNASTDGTALAAAQADTRVLPVRVLYCAQRGKGAAVQAGVAATDDLIVGFMDADGATDLAALGTALRLLEGGADLAIGSRGVVGSLTNERHSAVRALGARGYRRLARALVPDIHDTQCGFKLMRGDLARSVFAQTQTRGFSFDVEVLARALRTGARLAEFPVSWVDVPGSTFHPVRHGVNSFAALAAIKWRLREPGADLAGVLDLPRISEPVLKRGLA